MKLSLTDFKKIVESTPLISIDLVVRNDQGSVLLGKRTNRPAQNFWFVPGGRVLKDEPFEYAFKRLLREELGIGAANANFIGLYQHFYEDNFSEDDFSTHYIVLAYEITFKGELASLPLKQHSKYTWFTKKDLLENENIHKHSKWYFQENRNADLFLNNK
ncbi:GDP-mannose mannosyl hydrolase [Colwellia sp. MB02u-18]|uniref:GDP-mannose mannosyl hydrolase n=1 Tax=unclassified Colwellia TaxID=196834 RepID=UPI0015F5532E|nr:MULTISPECIES: GDP-mannose mannosyl hydrolase [unclassified Colwellia]MBA6224532.1 GDP-mannose mannosyl hydrolase [Colwellia sp. MB3u-45]MBA6268156.1 GDP-mannose mannosyl hydrolase [Colwellia sp. MB3u-43]MBA6322608.1 GDP-mannose mannosyl hydrolase [Colwellia sp. MB02u-19]MBA6326186.1 GDP-mannose mannosyl hydrolase [Colwellia sp. MB02u-18]MBA6331645.1 GDP-mannose mannosyl hydrolase [Colwellia sp. MB02u-12]